MWAELPLALLSRDQGTVIDVLQTFKYPSAKPQDCLTSRNFLLSGSKTDCLTQVLKTERFSLETTYTVQALFPDIKAILSNSRVVGAISGYKLAIQEIN